ncbi:metallophosphoesterase [Sphingomonas sp. ASY06-1R]|uniref:metallophosphoesterase n=1 Tax=Sphingomonas sp. ASY06-1R TaxID=3445771 RepID=UPI003FA2E7B0
MIFRRPKANVAPSLPPGKRVYAIGDVHGCLDLLRTLLELVERDAIARGKAENHVIMLGDLIDRGPASRSVIEHLLNDPLPDFRFHFLMGNHEDAMLRSLTLGADPRETGWMRFGGRETLQSYGVPDEVYQLAGGLLSDEMRRYIPRQHLDFLRQFEDKIIMGDYLFVHAGIRPGRSVDKQKRSDLLGIRDPFLNDNRSHGYMIVHGHSICRETEFMTNRIGIDTGAYQTGVLTALGVEGADRWALQTGRDSPTMT